jgi:phosphoacetylglucosamine mutase
MGEMLHASWEPYATRLANADSDDALVATLEAIVAETSTDLAQPAHVVYGHDTRPSCRTLVRALVDGLASTALSSSALETELVNAGLVTTPQLHYLVRCLNTAGTPEEYGEPSVEGYYRKLATAYTNLSVSRRRGRLSSTLLPVRSEMPILTMIHPSLPTHSEGATCCRLSPSTAPTASAPPN